MPDKLKSRFRLYLAPNESLIWVGEPERVFLFKLSDLWAIPLGIFAIASIFWHHHTLDLTQILIIAIAGRFLYGRFLKAAAWRSRQSYAITNRRVIIKYGNGRRSRVRSIPLSAITDVRYQEASGGLGTIILHNGNPFAAWLHSLDIGMELDTLPSLEMVEDAGTVYQMVMELTGGDKALMNQNGGK